MTLTSADPTPSLYPNHAKRYEIMAQNYSLESLIKQANAKKGVLVVDQRNVSGGGAAAVP
jgi:hypothetical protein